MTTKQHPGGDDAATLYALADAMQARAFAHHRDMISRASAGEWEAAEASFQAMRECQRTAAVLEAEAEAA